MQTKHDLATEAAVFSDSPGRTAPPQVHKLEMPVPIPGLDCSDRERHLPRIFRLLAHMTSGFGIWRACFDRACLIAL